MSGSSFENIAQELLKHKRLMETLEAENRDLRRQIADLREARGIFLEIGGHRFALKAGSGSNEQPSQQAVYSPPESKPADIPAPQHDLTAPKAPQATPISRGVADAPTTAMPRLPRQVRMARQEIDDVILGEDEDEKANLSPSVEKMLQEELSASKTNPLTDKSDRIKKPTLTEEEQKAALRRELLGSFLLE